MDVECVGMIGLGLMGAALARRFIAGGYTVVGWDLAPPARAAAKDIGVRVAASAPDVFPQSPVVVPTLPTSDIVEQVFSQASDPIRDGCIVVAAPPGAPDDMAALGARLHARGVHYLDATIAASSAQVH